MRSPARCVARRGNWRAALRRARQRRDVQRVARGFRLLLAVEQQGTAPVPAPCAGRPHARRDLEKKLASPEEEEAASEAMTNSSLLWRCRGTFTSAILRRGPRARREGGVLARGARLRERK